MEPIKCPRPGCPGLLVKAKQKQLGKTKDQLRIRGRKIATELLKGKSQEEALQAAGYSEYSARSQGKEILGNPVIQKGYCEVLEKAGLTDEFAAKTHHTLMTATDEITTPDGTRVLGTRPDFNVRARGLDMFYKVRGRYVEKKEISGPDGGPIKIHDMTDEELYAIAARGRTGNNKAEKGARKPA